MSRKLMSYLPATLFAAGLAIGCTTGSATLARADHHESSVKIIVADGQRTTQFKGTKADTGTAVARHDAEQRLVLTLSDDFKVPGTPAPHWQVVDSKGNTYLLNRLVIKGDKYNQTITVPSYVKDVATVQIWCAYAEVLLGEASFASPVK